MYHITKVHMVLEVSLKGYLNRFWYWHRCFTRGQGQGNGSGIGSKGHTLGHTGVRVSPYNDRPVVHGQVIQYLMDYISHCMVFPLGIACGDQSKVMHEIHQLGNVGLCLLIPDRCGVATRLVGTVHGGGNNCGRHRFQFLGGH